MQLQRFREARLAGEKRLRAAALHTGLGARCTAANFVFVVDAGMPHRHDFKT